MSNDKAPPQFISHETKNPNVNRSYYFTCPISEKYSLGKKAGQEMYKGRQDWKKHINQAVGRIITEKGVSKEDAEELKKDALKQLEECFTAEKNKPIINPAYEEYMKNKPKTIRTKKVKEDLQPKINELEAENEELKAKNEELEAENETLKAKNKTQEKQIRELMEIIEKQNAKKRPAVKKKTQEELVKLELQEVMSPLLGGN